MHSRIAHAGRDQQPCFSTYQFTHLHTPINIGLQRIPDFDPLPGRLIFRPEPLSISQHPLYVLLAEPALVVGYGDVFGAARAPVLSAHVEDTVGIHVEGYLGLVGSSLFWECLQGSVLATGRNA